MGPEFAQSSNCHTGTRSIGPVRGPRWSASGVDFEDLAMACRVKMTKPIVRADLKLKAERHMMYFHLRAEVSLESDQK